METVVLIIGAGPSGLATSACLNKFSLPNIILEKEDCCGYLWKKRSYDRLHLHLAKTFCSLPYMQHSRSTPTYMPKEHFIKYLDNYVSKFKINPIYCRSICSALYDNNIKKWRVEAKNTLSGRVEHYVAKFLVVATGQNSEGYIPSLPGLESFEGEIVHTKEYKSGLSYREKNVLVIGSGNSGMEIAYDLSNFQANTSIVIRRPVHVVSEEMVHLGMTLLKYVPMKVVDTMMWGMIKLKYRNLSKYGIQRPSEGPFSIKATKGKSPVIDVGTIKKIKTGKIKVRGGISHVKKDSVIFDNGEEEQFDALVFATGYKSTVNNWLKDSNLDMNEDGMPKNKYPSQWKGSRSLYFAGVSQMGLNGISKDARAIAYDIKLSLKGF